MTTSVAGADLVVTWQDSLDDHGSAVTAFIVTFKEADNLNFSQIETDCNPIANSAAFITKSCQVPMSLLRADPYSVPVGDLIVVKVQAVNAKGISDPSVANTAGILAQDKP